MQKLCKDILTDLTLRLTDRELLKLAEILPKIYHIKDIWSVRFRKVFGQTQLPKSTWLEYYLETRHIIIEVCWAQIKLSQGKLVLSGDDISDVAYFTGRSGNLDIIKFLTNLFPETEIFEKIIEGAARTGRLDIIQYSLKNSPKKCRLDKALSNAAAGAHRDVINYLIRQGADNWELALIGAAESGDHQLFSLFLEKVELDTDLLNLAMLSAVRKNDQKLLDKLSDLGANDWNEGLSEAVLFEHLELIEWFVKKGAKNFQEALYWTNFSEKPDYHEKVFKLLQ